MAARPFRRRTGSRLPAARPARPAQQLNRKAGISARPFDRRRRAASAASRRVRAARRTERPAKSRLTSILSHCGYAFRGAPNVDTSLGRRPGSCIPGADPSAAAARLTERLHRRCLSAVRSDLLRGSSGRSQCATSYVGSTKYRSLLHKDIVGWTRTGPDSADSSPAAESDGVKLDFPLHSTVCFLEEEKNTHFIKN